VPCNLLSQAISNTIHHTQSSQRSQEFACSERSEDLCTNDIVLDLLIGFVEFYYFYVQGRIAALLKKFDLYIQHSLGIPPIY
jgi:hypothetical protein